MSRNKNLPEKFRTMAVTIDKDVTHKRRNRDHMPTRKRLAQEASDRREADRLEKVAYALRGLAGAYDRGEVPELLTGLNNRVQVETVLTFAEWRSYNASVLSKAGVTAENYAAVREALLQLAAPPDRSRANKLAELEHKAKSLIGVIPGFYPTPREVAEVACAYSGAQRDAGENILEPSAGAGHLLDVIREQFPGNTFYWCEYNVGLAELLRTKYEGQPGQIWEIVGGDFLTHRDPALRTYHHIIMNPPFEGGMDAVHVRNAYELLAPGGSLVAIMSNSATFRTDGRYSGFRDWMRDIGATFAERFDTGTFKSSGTGANTVLLVMRYKRDEPAHRHPEPATKHRTHPAGIL